MNTNAAVVALGAIVVVFLWWLVSRRSNIPTPKQTAPLPTTVVATPLAKPTGAARKLKSTRLSELPVADDGTIDVGYGTGCNFGIVGESQRQAALQTIDAERRRRGENVSFVVELCLEPTNQYDRNAVKVCTTSGEHLGYLPRADAALYQMPLQAIAAAGKRGCCRAKLIGGTEEKPTLGVMIDLRDPHGLLLAVSSQPF